MFNEASLMLWCYAMVHFEVKMSHFSTRLKRTQLLVEVMIRARV